MEEHKKNMLFNVEKEIEEEKTKHLKLLRTEVLCKETQTDKQAESIDEKYEEIMKQLVEIRSSADSCKEVLQGRTGATRDEEFIEQQQRKHCPSPPLSLKSSIEIISETLPFNNTKDVSSSLPSSAFSASAHASIESSFTTPSPHERHQLTGDWLTKSSKVKKALKTLKAAKASAGIYSIMLVANRKLLFCSLTFIFCR